MTESTALQELIEQAHMAGQADAGVDPSFSNAQSYANQSEALKRLQSENEALRENQVSEQLVDAIRRHNHAEQRVSACLMDRCGPRRQQASRDLQAAELHLRLMESEFVDAYEAMNQDLLNTTER